MEPPRDLCRRAVGLDSLWIEAGFLHYASDHLPIPRPADRLHQSNRPDRFCPDSGFPRFYEYPKSLVPVGGSDSPVGLHGVLDAGLVPAVVLLLEGVAGRQAWVLVDLLR